MRHLGKTALAAAAFAWAGAAGAAPITGSLGFSGAGNETGQSLLERTGFTAMNVTTQTANGDFSALAAGGAVSIGAFSVPGGAAPSAVVGSSDFRASFTGGSFVAASVQKLEQAVSATGNESITAYFLGTFTPAGELAGFDPSEASVIANLNRSGSLGNFSVASAFTLAAPPAGTPLTPTFPPTQPVPEPASMALLGAGLLGLGLVRRRAK